MNWLGYGKHKGLNLEEKKPNRYLNNSIQGFRGDKRKAKGRIAVLSRNAWGLLIDDF